MVFWILWIENNKLLSKAHLEKCNFLILEAKKTQFWPHCSDKYALSSVYFLWELNCIITLQLRSLKMFCVKHLEQWKETLIHRGACVSPYTSPWMKSLFVSGSFPNDGIIMWTEGFFQKLQYWQNWAQLDAANFFLVSSKFSSYRL